MSGRYKDLTGQKIGNWTIIERVGSVPMKTGSRALWRCVCRCGKEVLKTTSKIKRDRSCGCMTGKHRMARTPEYLAWMNMRQRCDNPSYVSSRRYKERGIGICERWYSFEAFLEDMGVRPSTKHSLDRIDNSKGYSPGNCRWVTRTEQSNNRENNVRYEFQGRHLTLHEIAKETGVSYEMLRGRMRRSKQNWTIEGAISVPKGKKGIVAR